MRNFRDPSGSDWTVFEVRRQMSTKGDWSYLPNGYSNGWLCFENATSKKRLVRYPERWREFKPPAHLGFFTHTTLDQLLRSCGLRIVQILHVTARAPAQP